MWPFPTAERGEDNMLSRCDTSDRSNTLTYPINKIYEFFKKHLPRLLGAITIFSNSSSNASGLYFSLKAAQKVICFVVVILFPTLTSGLFLLLIV